MTARDTPAAPPAEDPPDLPIQVLRQFRQVFNAVKVHFQKVEKSVGLGGAQVWALSLVRDEPGIGIGALARAMAVRPSTASNLVRGLVQRGLVSADKDGADRRAVRLRLLAPGARVLHDAPGPFAGLLPDALKSLDVETLARLKADLALLIVALGADEGGASVLLSQL